MAVLGAMLLSPTEAGSEIRERLSDNHFYYSAHQAIFAKSRRCRTRCRRSISLR
jgi:replicative DNA helicase